MMLVIRQLWEVTEFKTEPRKSSMSDAKVTRDAGKSLKEHWVSRSKGGCLQVSIHTHRRRGDEGT